MGAAPLRAGRRRGAVDANGRVDLLDAILVALSSIDPTTTLPNEGDISLGDVNRDGRVDVADVYLIATYSVDPGNPSLPAGIGEPLVVFLEGKMYWVDRMTAKIQRANLDGSEVEDLVTTGLEEPTDLALDVAGGKMYWTDRLTDKIKRANLDGSRIDDLVTGIYSIWSLALDVDGGKMYWTNASWRGPKMQRANLDGSHVEDLVTTGLGQIAGMALDLAGGKMYWADWVTNTISRANLDGSQVEEFLTRSNNTGSVALVIPEGKMYWTEGPRPTGASAESFGRTSTAPRSRSCPPADCAPPGAGPGPARSTGSQCESPAGAGSHRQADSRRGRNPPNRTDGPRSGGNRGRI